MMKGYTPGLELKVRAFYDTIHNLPADQVQISMETLKPVEEEFLDFVIRVREAVDKKISAKVRNHPTPTRSYGRDPRKYPLGYCSEIRNGVIDILRATIKDPNQSQHPIVIALRTLQDKLMPLMPVYGIVNHSSGVAFQNEIQCGHIIIDCAGDTIDVTDPKVKFHTLESNLLQPINSYKSYADTMEKYVGFKTFSTEPYLPWIVPLFPLIMISDEGDARFPDYDALFFKNIVSNFKMGEEFIVSRRGEDTIPEEVQKKLAAKLKNHGRLFRWKDNEQGLREKVFEYIRSMYEPLVNEESKRGKRKMMEKALRMFNITKGLNADLYNN